MVLSIEVMLLPAVVSAVAPTVGTATLPAPQTIFLTSGFDYNLGALDPAVELPPLCSSSTTGACILVTEVDDSTVYTRNIESREDHSSLMKSVTKAEGGGFGISVSTGVEAMGTSKTTEASFAFFVGKSATTEQHVIQNPLKLQLNHAALQLLQSDPLQFLKTYGQHYVYEITYGGSFLGSFAMTERHSQRTSDLDVFAEVDASKLFFSAKASEDFEKKSSEASSSVESTANAKHRGGTHIVMNTSSPAALGKMFSTWEQSMYEHPAPLTMTLRSWMDCEQVQEVVNRQPVDVQEAFRKQSIAPVTSETLSEENGKMFLLQDSLEQAMEWTVAKTNATLRNQLQKLQDKAKSHQAACQTLSEVDILLRQVEIINNNFAWFVADSLTDEFEDIKARLPPPGVAQIVNPASVKCMDIYNPDSHPPPYEDGTKVELYTCKGNENQKWEFRQGQLVNPPSGKCLDIYNPGSVPPEQLEDETAVEIYTCLGNDNQKWELRQGQLVNPPSGKCLDIFSPTGALVDGARLQIYTCGAGKPNQQWAVLDAELFV